MRRQRSCSSMLLYYNPDYHSRRIPIPSSDHLLFSSLLFSSLLFSSLLLPPPFLSFFIFSTPLFSALPSSFLLFSYPSPPHLFHFLRIPSFLNSPLCLSSLLEHYPCSPHTSNIHHSQYLHYSTHFSTTRHGIR